LGGPRGKFRALRPIRTREAGKKYSGKVVLGEKKNKGKSEVEKVTARTVAEIESQRREKKNIQENVFTDEGHLRVVAIVTV